MRCFAREQAGGGVRPWRPSLPRAALEFGSLPFQKRTGYFGLAKIESKLKVRPGRHWKLAGCKGGLPRPKSAGGRAGAPSPRNSGERIAGPVRGSGNRATASLGLYVHFFLARRRSGKGQRLKNLGHPEKPQPSCLVFRPARLMQKKNWAHKCRNENHTLNGLSWSESPQESNLLLIPPMRFIHSQEDSLNLPEIRSGLIFGFISGGGSCF